MSAVATALSIVLAAVFLMAGVPKILRIAYFRERIRHWRLPLSLLPVIGAVELAGAGLLLVGAASISRPSAAAGALILVATSLGAMATHLRIADPPQEFLHAGVLGGLAAVDLVLIA